MSKEIYCISCHKNDDFLFCIPLTLNDQEIAKRLKRGAYPINAEKLKRSEFEKLRWDVVPGSEVAWHSDLDYYLEIMKEIDAP